MEDDQYIVKDLQDNLLDQKKQEVQHEQLSQQQETSSNQLFLEYNQKQQALRQNQQTISKLRAFNDRCRSDLKQLSESLEQLIEKTLQKKSKQRRQSVDDFQSEKVEQIKKEIRNKEFELLKIKREIQSKKVQEEFSESVHKIQELENTLIAKQKLFDELTRQRQCLEDIQRHQEDTISILNEDFKYKENIDKLTVDIREYKKQISNFFKEDLESEKQHKKLQDDLIRLELYFREQSREKGFFGNITKTLEEGDQKMKFVPKPETKEEKLDDKYKLSETDKPFSQESFNECVEVLKQLQKNQEEQKYENQLAHLQKQYKIIEHDKKLACDKYISLERETNIIISQLREKSRLAKQDPSEIPQKIGQTQSEMSQNLNLVVKRPTKITVSKSKRYGAQRQIDGIFTNNPITICDDNTYSQLQKSANHRIKKIVIYTLQDKIKFVKAVYDLPCEEQQVNQEEQKSDQKQSKLENNDSTRKSNLEIEVKYEQLDRIQLDKFKQIELVIEPSDPIKYISGLFTEQIDYLKIETISGKSVTAGKIIFKERNQEFRIELKPDNQILGLICIYRIKEEGKSPVTQDPYLEVIGVEYSVPFDPLRLPEFMKSKKQGQVKEENAVQDDQQEMKKKRIEKIVESRNKYKTYSQKNLNIKQKFSPQKSDKNLLRKVPENLKTQQEEDLEQEDDNSKNSNEQHK